jgi:DNA-binding NtrC family response regulator
MRQVFDDAARFAAVDATALITGEGGTGKRELARALHHASARRRAGPFVMLHSDCLPSPSQVESELFGSVKGGFFQAGPRVRRGALDEAQAGTLYLHHVERLGLPAQVRLLRALQERGFVRVGSHDTELVPMNVRVIASMQTGLKELLDAGAFRLDLYFRLNVLVLRLPPLRHRPEDVPILAAHFARRCAAPGPAPEVGPAALEALTRYSWPGNARELESAIQGACALAAGGARIEPEHLPAEVVRAGGGGYVE